MGERYRRGSVRITGLLGGVLGGVIGLAVLAGCAGAPAAPPQQDRGTATARDTETARDTGDTQRWMNEFCGAVHGFRQENNKLTQTPPVNSVADAQRALSTQLGHYAELSDRAVRRIEGLPKVGAAQAATVQQQFLDKFTRARDIARSARAKLDAAPEGDEASQLPAADALEKAQAVLADAYDPVSAVASSQELVEASASAPNCDPKS